MSNFDFGKFDWTRVLWYYSSSCWVLFWELDKTPVSPNVWTCFSRSFLFFFWKEGSDRLMGWGFCCCWRIQRTKFTVRWNSLFHAMRSSSRLFRVHTIYAWDKFKGFGGELRHTSFSLPHTCTYRALVTTVVMAASLSLQWLSLFKSVPPKIIENGNAVPE